MPFCIFKGCTNKRAQKKKDGIFYYKIPVNPYRREAWCRILREQSGDPDFETDKYSRICSAHFSADDIYKTKQGIRLKAKALPKMQTLAFQEKKLEAERPATSANVFVDNKDLNIISLENAPPVIESPEEILLKHKIKRLLASDTYKNKMIRNLQTKIFRMKKRSQKLIDIIKDILVNPKNAESYQCYGPATTSRGSGRGGERPAVV